MWKGAAWQLATIKQLIVASLETAGEKDAADRLNATLSAILEEVDSMTPSASSAAMDAANLTAKAASCGVLRLNSTLSDFQASVVGLARRLGGAFDEMVKLISDIAKSKLPAFAVEPVLASLT